MKKIMFAGAALLVLGGAFGIAQESKESPSGMGSMMRRPSEMPMHQSMKDYMQHHQAMMQSIDQMNTTMDIAKQSNDPVKMRTAIDDAQKRLMGMKEHMAMCGNMMGMMEKMHGMGGMMKGGSK
jgi:hypothetical protein